MSSRPIRLIEATLLLELRGLGFKCAERVDVGVDGALDATAVSLSTDGGCGLLVGDSGDRPGRIEDQLVVGRFRPGMLRSSGESS